MNKKYKYLIKNTGIFTICNFASKVLVFLLVPLYTSVLTKSEYGIYDLSVNLVSILLPVLSLNILDAVVRFEMDNKYGKNDVAIIGVYYISISIIIVSIIMAVIYFGGFIIPIKGLEWAILLYFYSYVLHQFLIQLARGLEKIKAMGIAGIISTATLVLSNIFFLLVVRSGLEGFYVSTILSLIVPSIFLAFEIDLRSVLHKPVYNRSLRKEMLGYAFPLVFSTLSWWVNSASDKYVVAFLLGVSENGLLSVAYKIPSIINTVFGMFGQAWQISAIKEYEEDKSKTFYNNIINSMNTLTIIGCGVLIASSEFIGKFLYVNEFFPAWKFAPLLIVSTVFNNASGLMGPILSAIKNTKTMAQSAIFGAVSNIILNIMLVRMIGIQGAAVATVISAAIIYSVRKIAVNKELNLGIDYRLWLSSVLLFAESVNVIFISSYYVSLLILIILLLVHIKVIKMVIVSVRVFLSKGKVR